MKYVSQLLLNRKDFNNTALILADESLLSLTLNSLPKNIDKINITMGFPLKDMPLASFFESVFKLYLNQDKFNIKADNKFYYKDVLAIIEHSYFKKLLKDNAYSCSIKLRKANKIFLTATEIQSSFKDDAGYFIFNVES